MNDKLQQVADLLNDPVCRLVMRRDGVKPLDVMRLMRTVRPVIFRERQDVEQACSMAA